MSIADLPLFSSQTIRPDYEGRSIVNLMSSIALARGYRSSIYPILSLSKSVDLHDFTTIVLLIIDGLGYNYVVNSNAGVLQEHLTGRLTSVFPPTTATAIPTFLTGNPPQQHGLPGWFTYLEEFDGVVAVLPFVKRGSKTPLQVNGKGPRELTRQRPLFECIEGQCHTVMPSEIAHSAFNLAFSSQAALHPYATLGQMLNTITHLVQQDMEPTFIHAYWPVFDRLSHSHGVASDQVRHHFQLIDAALGRFKKNIVGTNAIVIITADHGFIDSDPGQIIRLEEHPILSETLMFPLTGEPRVAYCYVYPDKREQFESYVSDELGNQVVLYRSSDLISNHLFGLGDCHPLLSSRIGHYALIAKERVTIRDRVTGEKPSRDIGVHGGTSEDEMYVPFIVMKG